MIPARQASTYWDILGTDKRIPGYRHAGISPTHHYNSSQQKFIGSWFIKRRRNCEENPISDTWGGEVSAATNSHQTATT